MHKLGSGELLFNGTFLAPEYETLHLEVPLGTNVLPVSIDFDQKEQDDKSPVTWKTVDGHFYLTFHGIEADGRDRILQVPTPIGSLDDRQLSLMFAITKHHKAYHLTVQFMAGGASL